jgi:hypothetical protein
VLCLLIIRNAMFGIGLIRQQKYHVAPSVIKFNILLTLNEHKDLKLVLT